MRTGPTWMWKIIDTLGDILTIPEKWSIHLLSIQYGHEGKTWPNFFNLKLTTGPDQDPTSLFMNGLIYVQFRFPFWIGIHIRPVTNYFLQTGLGFKGNGRFAILFRVQTDASAAAGMDGANYGQTTYGYMDGNK